MVNFVKKLTSGIRHYSLFDFAMLKLAMLSVGILLGTYFSHFFSNLLPAIWIAAIFCLLVITTTTLVKAFGRPKPEKRKGKR